MKFKELKLYTNKLEEELNFYHKLLGFELINNSKSSFSIKIGWSLLTFERTDKKNLYHYCFLIPCNKLDQALEWMKSKLEIIEIEHNQHIVNFDNWNADSFYFHDASENIVEFIAHHDLKNHSHQDFTIDQVLGINEIGLPTQNILEVQNQLKKEINSNPWKGDLERFGTNGCIEAKFLLPNYKVKTTWFPTGNIIEPSPFECLLENNDSNYLITFKNEEIKTRLIVASPKQQ